MERSVLRLRSAGVDRSYNQYIGKVHYSYSPIHPLHALLFQIPLLTHLLHISPLFYSARPFLLTSAVEDHRITRYTDLWPCLHQSSTCLSDLPPILKKSFCKSTNFESLLETKRLVRQFGSTTTVEGHMYEQVGQMLFLRICWALSPNPVEINQWNQWHFIMLSF